MAILAFFGKSFNYYFDMWTFFGQKPTILVKTTSMKVERLVSYSGFSKSCLLNTRTFLGSPEKRQKCEIMCFKKRAWPAPATAPLNEVGDDYTACN